MDGGRQKQFGQKQDIAFNQEYNQNYTDSDSRTGRGSDVTLSMHYGLKFLPFNNNKYAQ